MHGRRIAKNIVNYVKKNYGEHVEEITLAMGELVGLSKHELEDLIKRETSWKVHIVDEPGLVECLCGYRGPPKISDRGHDYVMYECPQCGSPLPKPLRGHEIKVVNVKMKG